MRVLAAVTPFQAFRSTCTPLGRTTISRPLQIQCWSNRIPVRWRAACRDISSNGRKPEQVVHHTQSLSTTSNMKPCLKQVELMLENTQSRVENRWELVLLTPPAVTPLQIFVSARTPKFTTPTSTTNELVTRRARLPARLLVLTLSVNEFATVLTKTWLRTIQRPDLRSKALCTREPSRNWNHWIGVKTNPSVEVCFRGNQKVWHQRIPLCPNVGVPIQERADREACTGLIKSQWPQRTTTSWRSLHRFWKTTSLRIEPPILIRNQLRRLISCLSSPTNVCKDSTKYWDCKVREHAKLPQILPI